MKKIVLSILIVAFLASVATSFAIPRFQRSTTPPVTTTSK